MRFATLYLQEPCGKIVCELILGEPPSVGSIRSGCRIVGVATRFSKTMHVQWEGCLEGPTLSFGIVGRADCVRITGTTAACEKWCEIDGQGATRSDM